MSNLPSWLDVLIQVFLAILSLGGMVGGATVWLIRHSLVSKEGLELRFESHEEEHRAIEKRLAEGERQFSKILADIENLPDRGYHDQTREQVTELREDVAGLKADIRGLREVLIRVERPLDQLVADKLSGGRGHG